MPKPKTWLTPEALISDLKEHWHSRGQQIRASSAEWQTSIREAVSANTFRAFQNLPARPSVTFRGWAFSALVTQGHFNELPSLSTQEQYDRWLDRLVEDFQDSWRNAMKTNISFGPSYKLPNLLMKVACQRLAAPDQGRILCFLHIPLDSFTLSGIRRFASLPQGQLIPASATMSFINNREDYSSVQSQIRQLAAKAGVPPIAYDYLAWDQGHR